VPIEWIIRKQGKVAMAEHLRSKRGDDGERLDVQVSEHLIRFPAAQESNFVRVDGCAQQSHRARGAQGSDRDVTGGDAPGGANGGDGCAKVLGKDGGGDGLPTAIGTIAEERCNRGRVVQAEV
jgi:hypothetical protein